MFKNYLKTAVRNIVKNKVYSFIIIIGFSIGLACVLLISMWVRNELSFDRFHSKSDRLYKVDANANFNNKNRQFGTQTNYTGPVLKKDLPEVEDYLRLTRLFNTSIVRSSKEKVFQEERIILSDRVFFSFFDFSLELGDRETALNDPSSVVISTNMAEKYFSGDNPLGKTLEINKKTYKVTGVIDIEAVNSHIKFDFLLTLPPFSFKPNEFANLNLAYLTYILLKENTDVTFFKKKANEVVNKYIKPIIKAIGVKSYSYNVVLRPLEDVYLHSPIFIESFRKGKVSNIYVMIAAAFIILFIVSFNYVNLSLARGLVRSREIGVRKINGASKSQVRMQLLYESLVQTVIAFGLAILILDIVLPMFNHITGRDLTITGMTDIFFALFILLIVILVAFLSGVYPAVFLSKLNPAELLRSKFFSGGTKTMFRKFFVIVQFALSVILIITTFFIAKQVNFMKEKDLGFNKNGKLVLDLSNSAYEKSYPVLKTAIERIPEVETVSVSSTIPGKFAGQNAFNIKGQNSVHFLWMYYVDYDFLPTHGLKLLEGRNFSRDIASDKTDATIINESTARKLGLEKPTGVIIEDQSDKSKYEVIGVIKDFHSESLREEIRPQIIRFVQADSKRDYKRGKYLTAAIKSDDIQGVVTAIKKEYNRLIPNQLYEYFFIDDLYNSFYREEERFNKIFFYSASLAIFLSCLGLFGLTSFMVQKRTKEIGIRKACGASISNIAKLLVKSFTKWIVIANIIAWPIAYFYVSKWLENFAYRTSIGIETFILSALLVLIIAVLAVSFKLIKASLCNPVEALKYE